MCPDPHEPDINGGIYDWNKEKLQNNRSPFNSLVTYSCGAGAKFENTEDKDENRTKTFVCQWNQTWTTTDRDVSKSYNTW